MNVSKSCSHAYWTWFPCVGIGTIWGFSGSRCEIPFNNTYIKSLIKYNIFIYYIHNIYANDVSLLNSLSNRYSAYRVLECVWLNDINRMKWKKKSRKKKINKYAFLCDALFTTAIVYVKCNTSFQIAVALIGWIIILENNSKSYGLEPKAYNHKSRKIFNIKHLIRCLHCVCNKF